MINGLCCKVRRINENYQKMVRILTLILTLIGA